jgi:predicted DNA-binding transcriptional regulator AlpA
MREELMNSRTSGGRPLPAPPAGASQIDEETLLQQVREVITAGKSMPAVAAELQAMGFCADGDNSECGSPSPAGFKPPPRAPPSRTFLSYADLERRYGKSRVTLWRWVRAGLLKAPYQIGPNSVGFASDELDERDAGLTRRTYGQEAEA